MTTRFGRKDLPKTIKVEIVGITQKHLPKIRSILSKIDDIPYIKVDSSKGIKIKCQHSNGFLDSDLESIAMYLSQINELKGIRVKTGPITFTQE